MDKQNVKEQIHVQMEDFVIQILSSASDDEQLECDSYGEYSNCDNITNYGFGIITSECGSGTNADCSYKNGCGGGIWSSFECNYPQMAPVYGYKNIG